MKAALKLLALSPGLVDTTADKPAIQRECLA